LRGVSRAANQEILKGFNMQGDSLSTTTSDERVLFTCSTRHYVGAAVLEIKSSKNLVLLLKTKISACNGTASNFSSLSLRVPQRTRPCPRDAFVPANRGKTGLHYLLPCTSRTLRHMHSQQQMDLQDRSHERFSRVLAQRLVCALLPLYAN
jgi:hypothetical protein